MAGRRSANTSASPFAPARGSVFGLAPDDLVVRINRVIGRRASPRSRRFVAAALAGLSVLLLSAGLQHQQTGARVVVAAHDIAAGEVLTDGDITSADLAAPLPPGLATDPADVVGRRTSVPLIKGALVTTNAILSAALLGDAGLVLAPVRLDDPAALSLVSPGDRVDVLAADTRTNQVLNAPATLVAADVRVVAAPAMAPADRPSLLGSGSTSALDAGPLLLAVDRPTAARLAAAAATSRISITIRSRS